MKDYYDTTSADRGITTDRKFTDILCAILFFAFLIFMGVISIIGYSQGDLDNIA